MPSTVVRAVAILAWVFACVRPGLAADAGQVDLPEGVRAVWDLDKAHHEMTPTRQRICINGLWRWQPAEGRETAPPGENWGFFKVPGCWPGITDYLQQDCQALYTHPTWKQTRLGDVTAAWYQRRIAVPAAWTGRRIVIRAEYVNSIAIVYIDSTKAGEIRFPAGELDVTALCRPGQSHLLSIRVLALPLKATMMSFSDTAAARQARGSVARRGLCGDVYLLSTPAAARIESLKIDTSVRREQITVAASLRGLRAPDRYALRAQVREKGRAVAEWTSRPFAGDSLRDGAISFTQDWRPEKLWDIHTPGNQYQLTLWLLDSTGKVLDEAHPETFAFREFWIEGRDFYLNGTRIFLSALPLDNAQVGAAWASYDGARESLLRLKGIGINFVYTHNYGCEPGTHLGFAEVLRACDDVGMLVAFSQPHFGQYDWQAADAERTNGYAAHAAFYTSAAGNHPSVVMYSMSHNAAGYAEDMNPDMIDGLPTSGPRDSWAVNNARRALRAEAIVRGLDPSRIVYHHAGGNIGSMHTSNFYTNMAPIQELDDWFEHWSVAGVKPLFTCEYMVPCTWDWTMYRGWYKGKREFGSAVVPWEFCIAEWSAQFLGDGAYRVGEEEKANIRWEAQQFRAGKLWHRWDYPHRVGSRVFQAQHEIIGRYLQSNWRAFRTWGVSAISPWEHHFYWSVRPGADRGRRQLPVDWDNLQRPGFSADYIERPYDRMDLGYDRADWIPTADGRAILRNNGPLLGYIGGKPGAFTSKDHNFTPGQTVEKQLIVINNSRRTVTCECRWTLALPQPVAGRNRLTIPTGQQQRVPLEFELPADLPPGRYELSATFDFDGGQAQEDSFTIDVLAPAPPIRSAAKVALYDPRGQTGRLLDAMGLQARLVDAQADLAQFDVLIIGKAGLTVDGPAPDISRVRQGLRVLVFEQTPDVLERRLGFRIAEYGLRQVFARVPDHPLLAGLDGEHLRDWRGQATILPPRLRYELSRTFSGAPAVRWCDIEVSRVWRCGNRGNVASVLIEKPSRGDFLPILDGGYSLQYSPLMEYREGRGCILFCQLDLTARTEEDPAALWMTRNILAYITGKAHAQPPDCPALYLGADAGRRHLESTGIPAAAYRGGPVAPDQVLIIGTGADQVLADNAPAIREFLASGGRVVGLGLEQRQANLFLPGRVETKQAEHIAAFFDPPGIGSVFAGIAPADVHNRDPRAVPLVVSGAETLGNGVLARSGGVVFFQFPPHILADGANSVTMNIKRTHRRTSFALSRLLGNLGVRPSTPLKGWFSMPVPAAPAQGRWLQGLYLDVPEEWDDPYRFFRW